MSGFCKGLSDYMATRYHEVSTQHDFQKLLFARRGDFIYRISSLFLAWSLLYTLCLQGIK